MQSVGRTGWNGLPLFHSVLGSVCVCFSYPNFWHVRYEKHNLMTSKNKIVSIHLIAAKSTPFSNLAAFLFDFNIVTGYTRFNTQGLITTLPAGQRSTFDHHRDRAIP